MPVLRIHHAEFVAGGPSVEVLPEVTVPEIAFVGRSNAGKSTFLNRLLGRKNLARTSAKPGKTQELNVYDVDVSFDETRSHIRFVDLPGYGYAQFSKKRRELLAREIVHYLDSRSALALVCVLGDIRRLPEEEEFAVRDICVEAGALFQAVCTKADKLSKQKRARQAQAVATAYGLEPQDLILSGENLPTEPAWQRILLAAECHPLHSA